MAIDKKLLSKLQKHSGILLERRDVHADVLRFSSPSANSTFGNGWGLPFGYGLALYGPPKCGKSLLFYDMAGRLHQADPEAIVVKYDTEFRDEAQLTPAQMKTWGIDPERFIVYQTNAPAEIFDHIADDNEGLFGLIKNGLKIRLVGIDSVSSIRGRRSMNATTIDTQQIGDSALTIRDGMKWITEAQKRGKFALVVTVQVAAELDPIEQMRGNKIKMAAAWGLQHHIEYFMLVEPNKNKEGKTDLLGKEYLNPDMKDALGNEENTAHRIKVTMKDSSLGPKGRVGEFTFGRGQNSVINVHEEIFKLGVNRGVIVKPNQTSYEFGGKKWVGKEAMVVALAESKDLQAAILKELMAKEHEQPDTILAEKERLEAKESNG